MINIVAVTGGRTFNDQHLVDMTLGSIHTGGHMLRPPARIDLLVHGGCAGADTLADWWATNARVQCAMFYVTKEMWRSWGLRAGPMRNRLMLEVTRPNLLVAFPGGTGTVNCVKTARELGIEVLEVRP